MRLRIFVRHNIAKHSSLFTKCPEIPVFIGIPRGEEYISTLHNSSPLFTMFSESAEEKTNIFSVVL